MNRQPSTSRPPFETLTLPSGLRIITERSEGQVVYIGYVLSAGTRHEAPDDSGMAHFIEHMTFKGTQRRTARQINALLEDVGGDLNAFTSKQETVYHATVLREHLRRAVDGLTDIVFHSTFPETEIRREVEVICDEIDAYRDTPSELIFDDFEAQIFANEDLGRDILGEPERLRTYTTADAVRFTSQHYRPERAVLYVLGDVGLSDIVRILPKELTSPDALHVAPVIMDADRIAAEAVPVPPAPHPARIEREKGTHQAHVMVGARTFGIVDERRTAMQLLNNILGGPGMNSRLNLALRERAGMVYTVDSFYNAYPDTGYWCAYFGCDKADVPRAERLMRRELAKLCERPLSAAALRRAKAQFIGQIGISTDRRESYAVAMGKQFAKWNTHRDIHAIFSAVDRLTPHDLLDVAREVYDPARLFTLVYR